MDRNDNSAAQQSSGAIVTHSEPIGGSRVNPASGDVWMPAFQGERESQRIVDRSFFRNQLPLPQLLRRHPARIVESTQTQGRLANRATLHSRDQVQHVASRPT